jgi:hypothetical protein
MPLGLVSGVVYENALALELEAGGIRFERPLAVSTG